MTYPKIAGKIVYNVLKAVNRILTSLMSIVMNKYL